MIGRTKDNESLVFPSTSRQSSVWHPVLAHKLLPSFPSSQYKRAMLFPATSPHPSVLTTCIITTVRWINWLLVLPYSQATKHTFQISSKRRRLIMNSRKNNNTKHHGSVTVVSRLSRTWKISSSSSDLPYPPQLRSTTCYLWSLPSKGIYSKQIWYSGSNQVSSWACKTSFSCYRKRT